MRIAFLGLGRMGQPMARNLLGGPHLVTVFNRTPGRASALVELGAIEASSVPAAVEKAEVAITMLADGDAVRDVITGPNGIIRHLPAKSIHLCMGTIGVDTSAALASAHSQADQGYVAAPIFGRPERVESRHLWILAGGPETHVNRCHPIFEALAQGHTRVGSSAPLAHALKLGGDIITTAMEQAVSEILIYTKAAGVPLVDYLRFLNTAIFRAHLADGYGSGIARPSFDPEDGTLDLAASELLPNIAKSLGAGLPATDLLKVRCQAAIARGWGERELAGLMEAFKEETGLDPSLPETAELPPLQAAPTSPQIPPSKASGNSRGTGKAGKSPHSPPPPQERGAPATPPSSTRILPARPAIPPKILTSNRYPVLNGGTQVTLDLHHTSHFEDRQGRVWAWSQEKDYESIWTSLREVETAFPQVMFLPLRRTCLLLPEAVLEIRPTFGGGGKVRVGEHLELDISRTALAKLKEILGI